MSLIGHIIKDNYEVLDKIGQGGMATVYRARQRSLDRIVAIKVLSSTLGGVGDFRERFEQEAKIIARLNHPNVVQVFDICEMDDDEGNLCIIMEFVDGRSLQQALLEQRPLRLERALGIAEQIASGLAYAHAQGVIHRDIKPQNIMLVGDDHVKIMDFGIARLGSSAVRTLTGTTLGTPEYMSPEQAQGIPVDHRTDIYSLAIVLYLMLTGELPFKGETPVAISLKHIRETPPSPRGLNPAITPEIQAVILRGMAKRPVDRFTSAEDLRQALVNSTPTMAMPDTLAGGQTVITQPAVGLENGTAAAPLRGETARATQRLGQKLAAMAATTIPAVRRSLSNVAEAAGLLVRRYPRRIGAGAGVLVLLVLSTVFLWPPGEGKRPTVTPSDRNSLAVPAPTPGLAVTPQAPGPAAVAPLVPRIPPRETELAMRRLNESPASDPDRAKHALESAQAAARRLVALSATAASSGSLLECLNGHINAVLYDRDNYRHCADFAQFLADNTDRWELPRPIRDGLLRDARELLLRAKAKCTDSADGAKIAKLDQQIEQLLSASQPVAWRP